MTNTEVIRLEAHQIQQASEVLAKAFYNDPVFTYILPEEGEARLRKSIWFFNLALRYNQPYGSVYTTAGSIKGVAIWTPPNYYPPNIWRMFQLGAYALPFKLGWKASGRAIALFNKIEEAHKQCMTGRHWYLAVLGVDPSCQGQGIGGQLLQPILKQADAENLPCYLETDTETNVGFYQKRGFEMITKFELPENGLRLWGMKREPQS